MKTNHIPLFLTLLLAPLAVSHAATNAPAPAKASATEGYADPGLGTRDEKKTTAVTDPAILDLSLEPPLVPGRKTRIYGGFFWHRPHPARTSLGRLGFRRG